MNLLEDYGVWDLFYRVRHLVSDLAPISGVPFEELLHRGAFDESLVISRVYDHVISKVNHTVPADARVLPRMTPDVKPDFLPS